MKLLLTGSVVLVLLSVGFCCYEIYLDNRVPVPFTYKIMNIPVVEDLDFLEGRKKLTSECNPGIYFEETLVPYSSDGTLYLSQDADVQEWVGELSTGSRDIFLCTLPDEAWADKAGSIRKNHIFKLWMVKEDSYYELKLTVSGMPVMTLTTEREEPQDLGDPETDPDRYYFDPGIIWYGRMQLFNPNVGVDQYEITETSVKYYLRGKSSSYFEKKSYSLGLLDAEGEKLNASLLGMREDNKWKLKGMVADTSKVREKTACQIWEMFDRSNADVSQPGPRMEYVELLLDNDYIGIYGLVEPVDEKKLGLDENDVLYKTTDWIIPEDADLKYAADQGWRVGSFIRIRYPDIIADYEKDWYPMRDYLNTFYRSRSPVGGEEDKLNLPNTVDMHLFNMAVSGSDNYFKNVYFVADVDQDGSYTMRQIPWDLDITFGELFDGSFSDDVNCVYEERAIPYLRKIDPDSVDPLIRARWRECRSSFLSTENILKLLDDNINYIVSSGAVARENKRWPDYKMSADIKEIREYQTERMKWLDHYFTWP